jgi:hypothetical protein
MEWGSDSCIDCVQEPFFTFQSPFVLLPAENQKSNYGVANELLREAEIAGRAKACLCTVQALSPQQLHPETALTISSVDLVDE